MRFCLKLQVYMVGVASGNFTTCKGAPALPEKAPAPFVSIIMLNYNGRTLAVSSILDDCLKSVLGSKYENFELLFVDNGSKDDSVDYVKKKFGGDRRLRVIENGVNLGFAEGNNAALPYAKGEYLLLLNNDVIVDPLMITELVQTAQGSVDVGVCGCRESRGPIGMCCDIYGFPVTRVDTSCEAFYVPGWALLTRREIVQRIGLFDSKYFAFAEDLDFCWRARLAGYQVVVNPKATAYHLSGGTLHAEGITESQQMELHLSVKRIGLFERNILRTLLKNYSVGKLIQILPEYFAMFFLEAFAFLFLAGASVFTDVYLQALVWNVKNLKDTWLNHEKNQESRKVPDQIVEKSMLRGNARIQYYKRMLQKGIPRIAYKK